MARKKKRKSQAGDIYVVTKGCVSRPDLLRLQGKEVD